VSSKVIKKFDINPKYKTGQNFIINSPHKKLESTIAYENGNLSTVSHDDCIMEFQGKNDVPISKNKKFAHMQNKKSIFSNQIKVVKEN